MNDCVIVCENWLFFAQNENTHSLCCLKFKVEKILKSSLDLIPSPVKIQIMGGKVYLIGKGKTLLGIVNKPFCIQKFVDNTQQCFAFTPFPPTISIFSEGEGDGIKSRLSS